MPEYNILEKAGLPQTKERNDVRVVDSAIREVSKKLGFDYYDGSRTFGFGGYYYDGRWRRVAKVIKDRYGLHSGSKVFIDRDEKGFLGFDLRKLIPGIIVYSGHCSDYAINHAMDGYGRWALINGIEKNEDPLIIESKARSEVIPFFIKVDNLNLLFKDNYFDCIISIHNICNYEENECSKALKELVRISKNNARDCYIQNDSWIDENGHAKLMQWVLICRTFLNNSEWEKLYNQEGYNGDWGFVMFK